MGGVIGRVAKSDSEGLEFKPWIVFTFPKFVTNTKNRPQLTPECVPKYQNCPQLTPERMLKYQNCLQLTPVIF